MGPTVSIARIEKSFNDLAKFLCTCMQPLCYMFPKFKPNETTFAQVIKS